MKHFVREDIFIQGYLKSMVSDKQIAVQPQIEGLKIDHECALLRTAADTVKDSFHKVLLCYEMPPFAKRNRTICIYSQ